MTRDIPVKEFATDVLIVGGGAAATMAAFDTTRAATPRRIVRL